MTAFSSRLREADGHVADTSDITSTPTSDVSTAVMCLAARRTTGAGLKDGLLARAQARRC